MAFGVADFSKGVTYSIPGRADGLASSSEADLMGILAAIVAMPPRQDIWCALITRAPSLNFKIWSSSGRGHYHGNDNEQRLRAHRLFWQRWWRSVKVRRRWNGYVGTVVSWATNWRTRSPQALSSRIHHHGRRTSAPTRHHFHSILPRTATGVRSTTISQTTDDRSPSSDMDSTETGEAFH